MSATTTSARPTAGRDKDNDELAQAVRLQMLQATYASQIAKSRRTFFLAYVAAGFTEAEALQLAMMI